MSRWGPPVVVATATATATATTASEGTIPFPASAGAGEGAVDASDDVELIDSMIWADPNDKFTSNELASRPRLENPDACGCIDEGRCCTDESCVLFACLEECYECLPQCCNQRISKKQWKKVEVFDAGKKGKGLRALEDIHKGDFIIEYVGKAIRRSYLERLFSRYKNERMLYIMALDNDIFIDARQKGGVARYINHSCDPACIVHRWKVRGVLRAGIFALRSIKKGEELSFDYQWKRKRGRAATKCHCGSSNCRGTLEVAKSMEEQELEQRLNSHWMKPPSSKAGQEIINRSIRIFSKEHGDYFSADVCKYDASTGRHLVMYSNLEEVWEDLANEEWHLLDEEAEQFFVIAKKQKQQRHHQPSGDEVPNSLVGTPSIQCQEMLGFQNFFYVSTDIKNDLNAKGFINSIGRKFGCSAELERIIKKDVKPGNDDKLKQALDESSDGLVWKVEISGTNVEPACGFLEKSISKLQQKAFQARPSPGVVNAAVNEEIIIPRCTVDNVKKRLPSVRDRCRSVSIVFAPSESKSKQFAKLQLEATLASDLHTSKEYLWNILLKACEESNAPKAPSGFYKDLGMFGGELRGDLFQMLVKNKDKDRLSQEANEDLRRSSFFASFESTQRCTVWVQSEDDMGRIDGTNRIIAEFNPATPRRVYFGAAPSDVPKLWALVEQRSNELSRGIRYFHLGADRMYQQLMMKNSGKFFEFIHQVTHATVTLDPMTGDHLRVDGGNQDITVGDWNSEHNLSPGDRACLAEELIRLQIEVYRDHCIRQQSWMFGRDWSLATVSTEKSFKLEVGPKSPRLAIISRGNTFDSRSIANGCLEIAEIVSRMDVVESIAAHATVIMYRFLKIVGDNDEAPNLGLKIREIVMACLFLSNKAQKVTKWKKLDSLLEAAYPVFFPGSKFNRKDKEASNFEQKVICAEREILNSLNYDVFWKGTDWVVQAAKESGNVAGPMAENTMNHVLSGPVLAAGADLWLKYGIEYIFTAVAGFLSVNIEPLFETLSLIPLKVSQAAQLVADSIAANGSSRKSTRSLFNGGSVSFLNNLETIKKNCMLSMAKTSFRSSMNTLVGGETSIRYQLIGQRDNRALTLPAIPTALLNEAVLPIIDAISAESKCRLFVAESATPGCDDIVLKGSWRALAIAHFLLAASCDGAEAGGTLPESVDSLPESYSGRLQAKTKSGLLSMEDVITSEGWEETIQSTVVANAPSYGRRVGGKACVAGKMQESELRKGGLRWWIPPSFAPSPSGSIHEMYCMRNPISKDDKRLGYLIELSNLGVSLLGSEKLSKSFPKLALFFHSNAEKTQDRFVAVSMQQWPPERIGSKEQGKPGSKAPSTGFSPAGLQELHLLTQLHSLIPSPMGHPNFVLPVGVAMPPEPEETSVKTRSSAFGEAKVEDMFSLFRTSEENERTAEKEKKRRNRAAGPHIVFNPIPFILTRVLQRSSKHRRDESRGTISPVLFSVWFHDLLSAVVHCHTNYVILRSLQSDQIVIDHSGVAKVAGLYRATALPKKERDVVIDAYQSSKSRRDKKDKVDDGDGMSSPYAAPELLLGSLKHTKETDIWAVGSLMAHLLLGKPLFVGKERSSLLLAMYKIIGTPAVDNYLKAEKFPFAVQPSKKYKRAVEKAFQRMMNKEDYQKHANAIDLIARMLHLDPSKRISAVDALKHHFIQNYTENCTTKSFQEQYVNDWMEMKKELVHSSKSEEDDARLREKSMKRKAMLAAAKTDNGTSDELDDLYDIDDMLGDDTPGKKARLFK